MKRLPLPLLLVFSALLGVLMGCGSAPTKAVSLQDEKALKSAEIDPHARPLLQAAERAYHAKKYKVASEGYLSLRKKFPGGAVARIATYRLGSIYYLNSQYPAAIQEFQSFLAQHQESELTFDVTYNLAAAQYQMGQYDKAFATLRRLPLQLVKSQGPRRAEVVYLLGIQTGTALANHAATVTYQAYYLQLPLDESKRSSLESNVVNQLAQMQSVEELNALLPQISEPFTRAKISERIAALSTTAPIAAASPMTPLPTGIEAVNPGALAAGTGDKNRLGVLLPLTGPLAGYGRKALDGILLAAGVFRNGGPGYEIIVEDTAGNPALAAQGVERLVREHNVIGIIGPISWKESLAAGDKAQELGVLNLSLTGKEGISERGPFLFQNALTPRVQVENLVKHCIQEKHFRRFAIVAPDNRFGEDMATEFMAVVAKLGGQVVGYETYAPEAKDFQSPIQSLVGLGDPRSRKMEYKALETFAKEQQEKTRRPSKARLPPIVDFDAVFLPDGPRPAAQIAASLAYFDVSGVALLGTSEWNSDQLYKRGGRLVEGALFPGGLSLGSSHPKQKEFVRLYADAYGSVPDLLAAQAYEAVELVGRAADASSGSRSAAVSELLSLSRFESPLGQLSFDSGRIALRVLPILSLEPGGNIVEQ